MLLSIFIRNRKAFLILVALAAFLKLALSSIEPASFELNNIIMLVASGHAPIGPWIALYPPLYNQTASNLNQLQSWPLTASLGSDASLTRLSLLFRLPVFLLDLGTMIVLFWTGSRMKSRAAGRLMALVWFLNPFSLFGVELLGLPDVLCIFLVALSFLLLVSEQPFLSAVALGLGAFVKFFPIFLLPPLLIYMHLKGARRRLLLAAAFLGVLGFIGYFGWILPYGFEYLEIPTPVTQQILFVGGIANTVNPVTFGMFGFYGLQYIFMKKDGPLPMLLSALLAYYILAAPGPQYLMWVLPLVAVDVVFADRLKRLVISVLLAFVFLQWFLVSSAFLTPSGYSLLMFPLGGGNTSLFSAAIGNFLDSRLVDIIILPLVSSATFAMVLAYSVEQTRLWFSVPQTQ